MQKIIIISLILLQGCNMRIQADSAATDSTNEIASTQANGAAFPTGSVTIKQRNRLMQQLLQQNQWLLVSYFTSQGMLTALPEHQATLLFSGHKVSGSTGCNQYFAAYQLVEQHGLQFSQAGSTMMACQGEITRQEQQYLKNLAETRFYKIQGEYLHLLGATEKARLIFKAMPVLTLEDNEWQVTGINNGHGGIVSSRHTHLAYLQFSEGKLLGSSGCNTLTAGYQTEKSELSISPIRSTQKFCAEEGLMTQEQQMLQVLTQVTNYKLRTNQLRLLNTNGSLMMSLKRKQ